MDDIDVEANLISKCIREEELTLVLDARITVDFFIQDKHREAWAWILDYYSDYAVPPTSRALKDQFPEYTLFSAPEPLEYYVDRIKEQRRRSILQQQLQLSLSYYQADDIDGSLTALSEALTKIGQEVTNLRYENLVDTWPERLTYYTGLSKNPNKMRGIPLGWPSIDASLSGIQPEQFIVLIGPPKAGKSTAMMVAAHHVWLQGKKVLFFSFEMSNEEQRARFDAIHAQINYSRLMNGTLNTASLRKLGSITFTDKGYEDFVLASDITSATTVPGVAAKIEEYRPDVVFIDGVYLMDPSDPENMIKGSSQALTDITRAIKRMAQRFQIPIVGSTQVLLSRFNAKKGLRAGDVGYTSSFAQDNDAMLGVSPLENEPGIVEMSIVQARNARPVKIRVNWDWTTSTFAEIDEKEGISDAEPQDEDTSKFE